MEAMINIFINTNFASSCVEGSVSAATEDECCGWHELTSHLADRIYNAVQTLRDHIPQIAFARAANTALNWLDCAR